MRVPSLLCVSLLAVACGGSGAGPDAGGSDARAGGEPDARVQMCQQDPCDVLPQCGCDGQACDIDPSAFATGGTMCRDFDATGNTLASCTALSDCGRGFVCLGGQCRAYCNNRYRCGESAHCLIEPVYRTDEGTFEPIPGITACTKACKPAAKVDNGCPSDPQYACRIQYHDPDPDVDGDQFWYSDCGSAPASGGLADTDCSEGGDSACAPGYDCVILTVGEEQSRVCRELCALPDGTCTSGTCMSFSNDPKVIVLGVEYGVCLNP